MFSEHFIIVKSVFVIKSLIKAINIVLVLFLFFSKKVGLVWSAILYQLTSTDIQCPWCGIENGISGT